MRRNGLIVLAACAALVALAMSGAGAASAAPSSVVTVSGALPAPVSGPPTATLNYTITVSGAGIDAAILTVNQPATMPADPATVQIDGVAAPAGTVDVHGLGLTIRLGTGADATQGGQLAIGAYLVTFDITVPATVPTGSTASATLAFTSNAVPGTSASNLVSLSGPDLALAIPPGSGEDAVLPLGTGQTGFFDAELTNAGADAGAVTLTITVPVGLAVDTNANPVTRDDHFRTDDGFDAVGIPCAPPSGNQITCTVGAVAHGVDTMLEIPVTATPAGTPGDIVDFVLTVSPDGAVDANPDDNTLTARIRLTGIAVLIYTLTPSSPRVTVGTTIHITTSVRNDGPQPAEETVALAITDSSTDFTIVDFTGNTTPPAAPALAARAAKHTASLKGQAAARRGAAASGVPGPAVIWFIGTIPAHTTATATLTLKAVAAGTTHLAFLGGSTAGNPACDDPTSAATCRQFTQITLTAVAATATTAAPPTTAAPAPPPTTPTLANTGRPVGALLLAGFTALALGATLTAAAARPRSRRRSRRT